MLPQPPVSPNLLSLANQDLGRSMQNYRLSLRPVSVSLRDTLAQAEGGSAVLLYESERDGFVVGKCDCGRLIEVPLDKTEPNTHGYFLGSPIACACGARHVSLRLPNELLEERKMSEQEKRLRAEARQLAAAGKAQVERVMVLSLPYATGYEITQHFDVVTAEVVLGTGFMSEWDAAFADFFGDRSALMEEKLNAAKQAAMWKMKERALLLDADAVLAVDVDYHTLAGNLLMVVVTGTPVRLQAKQG